VKLTNHDGDQSLTLEWGGMTGRAIVLTVEETEGANTVGAGYVLMEDECRALAAVLTKMAECREREEGVK
jgi:hypothetical protein